MMTENEYLPYKAINVFIDRKHLENVLETILKEKDNLLKEQQIEFTKFFKQYVNILGFRNPSRAPLSLQINAYASAFEEKDEVVPFTLSKWVKIRADLADKVLNWLDSEGWDDLALERTYAETEGFIHDWPDDLSVDQLVKNFNKANPDIEVTRDDLIMMVLWISGQLPEEQSDI